MIVLSQKAALEENGILTLIEKVWGCVSPKVYDVQTSPPNQVIGARGFDGMKAQKEFFIQVSPHTETITLTVDYGIPKKARYNISTLARTIKEVQQAETGTPSWMKSWQNTETNLIATAELDKNPPIVQVLSPSPVEA